MTESHLGSGRADPGSADLAPEIPQTDQIYGHDVRMSYGQRYVVIEWKTGGRIVFRFGEGASLTTQIVDRQPEGLVSLQLLLAAGHTQLTVDLPFYAKDLDRLQAFSGALQSLLPRHADVARSGAAGATRGCAEPDGAVDHGPPGVTVPDRGQAVGTDRPDRRERQVTAVVTISVPAAPPADDKDWISLRPPAETERLLQPAHEDPAEPVPENSQHA